MRILLDSNVLVRAVISPKGPAAAVYDLIQAPHVLVTSTAVVGDLVDALRYPHIRVLHGLTDDQVDVVVHAMHADAENVPLPSPALIPFVCADRDDDFILATAVLGNADILCTRDRHLRSAVVIRHCRTVQIEVLTDVELLARLRPTR